MQAMETESRFALIAPGDMEPYPGLNPRTHFDDEELIKLSRSIKSQGVRQALAVHDRGEGLSPRFWVVAGERRWSCATELQLSGVPCTIGIYTEAEAFEVALTENLQRAQLRPMEESRAFERWFALNPGKTQEELAERVGMSQPYIANRLRMLELPEPIQKLVDDRVLQPTYARDMLLPWTKEEPAIATRFFNILAQHVQFRTDYHEPIAKAWLAGVVERIGVAVKPGSQPAPAAQTAPAPAPASAASPAPTPAAPPAPSKPDRTPAPAKPAAAAAPVPPVPAIEPAPVIEATAEPAAPPTSSADDAQDIPQGIEPTAEPVDEAEGAAQEEQSALPAEAPSVPGVIGAVALALGSHSIGISIFRDGGTGPVIVTVSARPTKGGTAPSPLLIRDTEENIEAAVLGALRPFIANLPAA